jgi:uncharacterized protein
MGTNDSTAAIDTAKVIEYMHANPGFFEAHPELLNALRLPKQTQGTTSLAAYQLDVLREKNTQLLGKLSQLIQIAQDNELLVQRVHLLSLRLVKARSLHETLQQIGASLQEDFHTDLIKLCFFDGSDLDAHQAALAQPWLLRAPEAKAIAALGDATRHKQAICGRLRPEILEFVFAERAGEAASAVLLPLEPVGLLAIGSSDPNRFHPGMGTVVLEMIAELLRNALAVQLDRAA